MSEHHDRILDLALHEELGGETPPDLSNRIRWQLAQNLHRQARIELVKHARRQSWGRWAGRVMGAAAALAVILFAIDSQHAQPQPALSFVVEAASLRWQADGSDREFREPNTYTIFPVLGDRLHASPQDFTVLKLAGLGILEMSPGCVLEVEEMQSNEFGKGFVVGAIVVAVVAGTAHFMSDGTEIAAATGERLPMLPSEESASMGEAVGLRQQIADLRSENERLLETVARRRAEIPAEEVVAETPAALEIGAVITYADFAESLDAMDWAQMGLAAKDMIPKLQTLFKALADGEDVPIDLAGEIQQLNGQILQNLGKLQDGQIPGTGINGSFTHPVFAANLMNATLAAAGVALDEGQLRALQDLTNRFAGEDDSRRGTYGDDVPMVQQLIEEIGLRSRFFEQAKAAMSPEQLAAIGSGPGGPGPTDIFSGDPAWQQFTKTVKVSSRSDFAGRLTGNLLHGLKFDSTKDAAQIAKVTQMIDTWAQAAPQSYFSHAPGGLANAKAFPSAGVHAAAQYQAQLFSSILANVQLSPGQRTILLKNRGVFIPLYTGKK